MKSNEKQKARKEDEIKEIIQEYAGEDHVTTPEEIKRTLGFAKVIRAEDKDQSPKKVIERADKMAVAQIYLQTTTDYYNWSFRLATAGTSNSITQIRLNQVYKSGKSGFLGVNHRGDVEIVADSRLRLKRRDQQRLDLSLRHSK